MIFLFQSEVLQNKLKVSGNSKKLKQLKSHTQKNQARLRILTIEVIVIVIVIVKTITTTL